MKFITDVEFYNLQVSTFLISITILLITISNLVITILFSTVLNSINCSVINGNEVSNQ